MSWPKSPDARILKVEFFLLLLSSLFVCKLSFFQFVWILGIIRVHDDGTIIYDCKNLSDKFVQRVAANPEMRAIIYTPRGQNLQTQMSSKEIFLMFDCFNELGKFGIIHRKISPDHFLATRNPSGKIENIFLIDFAWATFEDKEGKDNLIELINDLQLADDESGDETDENQNKLGKAK